MGKQGAGDGFSFLLGWLLCGRILPCSARALPCNFLSVNAMLSVVAAPFGLAVDKPMFRSKHEKESTFTRCQLLY